MRGGWRGGEKEEERKEGRAERDSDGKCEVMDYGSEAGCVLTEHPRAGFLSPSSHRRMQWKPLITVGVGEN